MACTGRATALSWTDADDAWQRRKEIYELLHPETRQGTKGGWHNNKTEKLENANSALSSFVETPLIKPARVAASSARAYSAPTTCCPKPNGFLTVKSQCAISIFTCSRAKVDIYHVCPFWPLKTPSGWANGTVAHEESIYTARINSSC